MRARSTEFNVGALLLLSVAASGFVAVRGKHIDVVGNDREMVSEYAEESARVAEVFVGLFQGFPGKKAAVVLMSGSGESAPEKAWKKYGAKWEIPWVAVGFDGMGDVWAHELAKSLISKHVNERASKALVKRHKDFGSYLPDWLDEGIAGLHAKAEGRQENRVSMREILDAKKAMPLGKLSTMDHPAVGRGPGVYEIGPTDVTDPNVAFEIESLSVCEYLLERFGVVGVRVVVETALKNKALKDAVKKIAKHHRPPEGSEEKPPKTLAEFKAAWKEWAGA